MEEKKEEKTEIIEIKTKEDLNKLTKQELKDFGSSCLEIINNLVNTEEKQTIEKELQLDINILEVKRRKLHTIFEILSNTSSVLENKVNDSGIKYNRLNLEDDSFNTANNVVRTCLEQLDTWLKDNDLNDKNYETNKKQND